MSVVIEFNKKTKGDPVKPSYDDVLAMANALTKTSISKQVSEALKAAAKAELDPVDADMILIAIQAKMKIPKRLLRKQLHIFMQELGFTSAGLALEIALKIRNEHFNGGAHLVRCVDGSYWVFDDTHWRETTGENLRRLIQVPPNV